MFANCRKGDAILLAGTIRYAISCVPSRSFQLPSSRWLKAVYKVAPAKPCFHTDLIVATPDATFAVTPAKLGVP